MERGRPRDRGPARSGGCGGTSTVATKSASERQSPGPARVLAPIAWLQTYSTEKIIAPSKWFGPNNADKETKDLIPERWSRI